jgi:hypothetical protein
MIAAETEPCGHCGRPHPRHPTRGYAAADGHAWRAKTADTPPSRPTRYATTGIATAFVVKCTECQPPLLVLNDGASITEHDQHHDGTR